MKKHTTSLLLFLFLFSFSATAQFWGKKISGKGEVSSHQIDLQTIKGINLGVPATVHLTQSNQQSIKIDAQQNIYDLMKSKVSNGSWSLTFDEDVDIRNHKPITIYVSLATLEELSIGGMGSIKCTNHFNQLNDLDISIGGSGEIYFTGDADEISCNIGGMGTIEMKGQSKSVDISIGGSGKVRAIDMETQKCEVSSAGSGDVEIHVNDRLNVSMVGSGNVHYKGSPKVNTSIVGSGDISKY